MNKNLPFRVETYESGLIQTVWDSNNKLVAEINYELGEELTRETGEERSTSSDMAMIKLIVENGSNYIKERLTSFQIDQDAEDRNLKIQILTSKLDGIDKESASKLVPRGSKRNKFNELWDSIDVINSTLIEKNEGEDE